MKKRLYILAVLAISSAFYGAFSIYTMLFNNRIPYTVECIGVLLDKSKVMAISNYKRESKDTLFVNYSQSKVIMPNTLGYIYFDDSKNEYILKNNVCIYNPENGKPGNYFLPFSKTLNEEKFSNGDYFGPSERISQDILLEKGIKYNSAVGTPENRVSVQLIKFGKQLFLRVKDDGIGVKYPIKSNSKNYFQIISNQTVKLNCPNIYFFDNTTLSSSRYALEINASIFNANYTVTDFNGSVIKKGSDSNPTFTIGEYLFSIKPKYSKLFIILYLIFNICVIVFQVFFLKLYFNSFSPIIQSLFSIRILLNSIVMLAAPLFLTSYYIAAGRMWYLGLVLLLNISYFIPKGLLHKIDLEKNKKTAYHVVWLIVIIAVLLMVRFTQNESLFGIIPVLHVQQIIILLLIFLAQSNYKKTNNKYWLRIVLIIIYTIIISIVTSDYGSLIYTVLSFLLVELVRKTIKIKTAFKYLFVLIGVLFIGYNLFPEILSHGKNYRIIAPYVSPESNSLFMANQAARESYSTLLLNLKNIVEFKNPYFNDVVIPANMRSTCHSDFAFHWSYTFGGFPFLLLFITTILALVSSLTLLLYCSIRECRIEENKSFAFPKTREADLVRFVLAFTIISLVYPIASNLLLIPLTGQSIPCLSISNVEVIYLIFLLVSLSSIFTNEKYINTNAKVEYRYGDAKASMQYAIVIVSRIFVFAVSLRFVLLYCVGDTLVWKKHISNDSVRLNDQIPLSSDKKGLVGFSKKIIGSDDLTCIDKKKKPILKNLASLYYFNIPYSETVYEPLVFSNSVNKLLNQMAVDSLFNTKTKLISGVRHPFGLVYAFNQRVNNKQIIKVTNDYYNSIPFDAQTINSDLTAECAKALETHLTKIGISTNIGSVMIVENITGNVITNSSLPLDSKTNSNETYYLVGSLKKILIAYVALKIDPSYREKVYGGKTFSEFLKYSDDFYSASLLKDLLLNNKSKLNEILINDFDLPLYSLIDDSYLDSMPSKQEYKNELNRNNSIYRQSIGQQKPYMFSEVMKWYSRVGGGLKVELSYIKRNSKYPSQSLNEDGRKYLLSSLHNVLYGTASVVRIALEKNNIKTSKIICKTGTAERSDKQANTASSFILSTDKYTIGIMLKGTIPDNEEKLSAKDLFVSVIPILKKYQILK